MPLYEYECDACGGRFEVIQKFSETTTACRRCGKGPVRRLVAAPAIQFKGTGWYITDYAQKGKPDGGGPAKAAGDTAKADAAPSESSAKSDSAPTPAKTTTAKE